MENVLSDVMKDQLDKFDVWLRNNLDRSFPDHVILSVFQFHFIKSFVDTDVSFDDMMKLMKDQYDVISNSKVKKEVDVKIEKKPQVKSKLKKPKNKV